MAEQVRALVSGGAGFIGSHLVEALLDRHVDVRVVDNLVTGSRDNLGPWEGRFEWVEGDLADSEVARAAARDRDVIFHLAAIPSVPRSVAEPLSSHAAGPTATLNLLEAARSAGARRFIFSASSSAYGEAVQLPKHEGMIPAPLSPYAAGKVAGEHYVSVYAKTMGLDGVSLRYFNIFGPRQDPGSPYSGVISLFVSGMLQGRRPRILGDGLQTRDFTYVANAVDANLKAMAADRSLGGAVYNVGSGRSVTLRELVEILNQILLTQLEPEYGPARAGDVRDSLACLDLAQRALNYRPLVAIEEGLARTVAWFKSQRPGNA